MAAMPNDRHVEQGDPTVCRHATTELAPEPMSARSARRFLRRCLDDWSLGELLDDGQVAISELVTNAVTHGAPPLFASVSCEGGYLELAVFDGSEALPAQRTARPDLVADLDEVSRAEALLEDVIDERDPRLDVGQAGSVAGGRGLLLVEALADQWGVSPRAAGKAVWVRTALPSTWQASPCPCGSSPDAAPLASGRRAVDIG